MEDRVEQADVATPVVARPDGSAPQVRSAALQLTFVPSDLAPGGGTFALWGVDDIAAAAAALDLPAGTATTFRGVRPTEDARLVPADLPARSVPLLPVLRRLAELPPGSDWPAWRRPSGSLLAWSVAAKLALEFVAGGRLVPSLRADEEASGTALWRAAPPRDGRLAALAESFPVAAHALRRDEDDDAVWEPAALLRAFVDAVADVCGRAGARPELDHRRRAGGRPWVEAWPLALRDAEPTVERLRVDAEDLADELRIWAEPLLGREDRGLARLAVRLEPPAVDPSQEADDRAEVVDDPWRMTLLLQLRSDPSEVVPASEVWRLAGAPLELGGKRVEDAQESLVRGLTTAARLYEPLDRALSESRPTGIELDTREVATFLAEGVDALGGAGIGVQVPPELRDLDAQMLRARIRIGSSVDRDQRVEGGTGLGLSDMATFRYEIALGDRTLDEDEFAELVALGQPLVRWRGQWVRIDHDQVDRLAALRGDSGTLDITEALAAALSGQREHDGLGFVETVADGDVARLVQRLKDAGGPNEAEITGITGDLRAYQVRGVGWMQSLAELGMGGILADEMGLGKTLQAMATITSRPSDRPHLVVCPTSVVGNWERELNRFAPDVPVIRHHGPERPNYRKAFRPGHVVVTSYALLRRDLHLLEDIAWDTVIFDEAQQVKNASSKGAKAARGLEARIKFALTGTPIENRLSELWAILDLTTPGLLGNQRRFTERFAVPVERWHDREAAERLRRLIAPFVLRRLKADPDVSVDLPPKNEITVTCSLTREQASLYQAAVDDAFSGKGLGVTTFERRGRILALLTALKQICNHPRQYLRDGGKLPNRSGKLSRVTEILQEVVDSGDRALIFTQYREMGHLLEEHLGRELGLPDVPFLHGGVPLGGREAMVDAFQDDDDASPLLLVSLRAGGSGLNLTRATEVIHYDRWWNPAVEQQATDRAHRIGQTRTVNVHKLVTSGTIEERIDELLTRKQALADSVVGEGEAWITELGDEELRELVALNSTDVEDDEDAA